LKTLKFRAWNKRYRKIYEISDLHMATLMNGGIWATVNGYNCIEDKDIKIQIQPNEIEVMQYTGLKDKNSKEIYEGDIVTNKTKSFSGNGFRGKNLIMLGEWDQDECFHSLSVYDEDYWGFKKLTKSSAADIEVIGNIYQNPELVPNKN
jgi:uncharacterized phage protein (TIGR01671 family)